jgi:hypothetical protein
MILPRKAVRGFLKERPENGRVLPSYGVGNMVKALTIIEEQVSKKVPHFRGPIPQGFEVFLGRYSSNLGCSFGRAKSQNDPAHLFSS